jgi:hypothetical protein
MHGTSGVPSSAGNLLSSASFENGHADGWAIRLAGTNRAVYSNPSRAHDGSGFMEMNNGSVPISNTPSIYQDVPVAPAPGHSYSCSLWVRSPTGAPFHGNLTLWGLGGTNESGTTGFTAGSHWRLVTAPLNPLNSGHTQMRCEIYMGTAGVNLDVDGASMTAGDI